MRPILLLALTLLPSSLSWSQARPFTAPIDSGKLVRLIPTAGDPIEGRLLGRLHPGDDSVRYCRYPGNMCTASDSAGMRATALASLDHVEITTGTRADRGMLLGGTIGAGLGLLMGAIARGVCESGCADQATYTIYFGAGGLLWGALFGSMAKVWRPAP